MDVHEEIDKRKVESLAAYLVFHNMVLLNVHDEEYPAKVARAIIELLADVEIEVLNKEMEKRAETGAYEEYESI